MTPFKRLYVSTLLSLLLPRRERDHEIRSSSASRLLDRHNSQDERARESSSHDLQRSRSRSPLRNGPDERPRSNTSLREPHEIRIKEEQKDILVVDDSREREREKELREREQRERERELREREMREREERNRNEILRNDLLKAEAGRNNLMPMFGPGLLPPNSMLERERFLNPAFQGLDRPPQPGLWNPFDRAVERQRMEALERERLIRSRFPTPLASMIERERSHYEQEMMLRDRVLRERQAQERELEQRIALDRVAMERERIASEMADRNKIPPLRPVDPFFNMGLPPNSLYLQRNSSPLVNHNSRSKTNSPSSAVGVPPPLIPSGSVRHTGSPSTTKPKPNSPVTNSASDTSKDKPEPSSNGHDTDAQSR